MSRAQDVACLTWVSDRLPGPSPLFAHPDGAPRPEYRPSRLNDVPAPVFVAGPADRYDDEEIALLADFARRKTAWYDDRFATRHDANAVFFDKLDAPRPFGLWRRRRLTWTSGPALSRTLPEALAVFENAFTPEGRWIRIVDGPACRIGPARAPFVHDAFPETGPETGEAPIRISFCGTDPRPRLIADDRARLARLEEINARRLAQLHA